MLSGFILPQNKAQPAEIPSALSQLKAGETEGGVRVCGSQEVLAELLLGGLHHQKTVPSGRAWTRGR